MSIGSYLKSTKDEIKQVSWPKRNQVIVTTIAVVLISAFVAYFLGLFDFLFSKGLSHFLNR